MISMKRTVGGNDN